MYETHFRLKVLNVVLDSDSSEMWIFPPVFSWLKPKQTQPLHFKISMKVSAENFVYSKFQLLESGKIHISLLSESSTAFRTLSQKCVSYNAVTDSRNIADLSNGSECRLVQPSLCWLEKSKYFIFNNYWYFEKVSHLSSKKIVFSMSF